MDATQGDDTQIEFTGVKDGNVLNLQKETGTDNNLSGDLTTRLPLYMVEGEPEYYIDDKGFTQKKKTYLTPTLSGDFYTGNDINQYGIGFDFPITKNISADISTQKYADDTSAEKLGLYYNKPIAKDGIFSIGGEIDSDRNKNLMVNFSLPFGEGDVRERESILMTNAEKRALEAKKAEDAYNESLIYAGSDFKELKDALSQNLEPKDFIGPKLMARGGLAGLLGE